MKNLGSNNRLDSPILPGIPCKFVLCWVGIVDKPDAVVPVAQSLATRSGGRCHVVMGLDSPWRSRDRAGVGSVAQAPLTPETITHAERQLAALYRGEVHTMVLPGHPVLEVRRYARNHNVDLIVMGEQALAIEQQYGERLADQSSCAVMILLPPRTSQQNHSSQRGGTRSFLS